jgi:hypothetical protein
MDRGKAEYTMIAPTVTESASNAFRIFRGGRAAFLSLGIKRDP